MGIAILSGVIDSLDSISGTVSNGFPKWETHTPGTLTPVPDSSVPGRFLACVNRVETAQKLRKLFDSLGGLGSTVEVLAGKNLEAVQAADVIILWYYIFLIFDVVNAD